MPVPAVIAECLAGNGQLYFDLPETMKKFSTGPLFSGGWALGGAVLALAPSLSVASSLLPEYVLPPRPRVLAPLPQAQRVGDDSGRPLAMVLDPDAGPFAKVTGPAAARDATQLFVAGQAVRIALVGASHEGFVSIYRLGPVLRSSDGGTALGRMAFRIGGARIVRRDTNGKGGEAVITSSSREIVAGDIVLDAQTWPQEKQGAVQAVAARVVMQSGAERMRLAAADQVVGLDRGAADGVHAGMCLRVAGCGRRGDIAGRVLHAGGRASVAQLVRGTAPLEGGDEVCIAACPD